MPKRPPSGNDPAHIEPAILPGGRSRFLEPVRRKLELTIFGLTSGAGAPRIDFLQPAGDPGLFGPDSVCWRVHGDFSLMMIGGVSALLLQALHPLALAGVWDHSNFRQDILGRLRRTSSFVGGTTFAGRADAQKLIERVRRIHESVVGTAPDGRPYAAGDPDLLTWVHVAEMSSFLGAHLRYAPRRPSAADQDRYYAETAVVAELLGARGVPRSVAEVQAYFQRMRPELVYSDRSREVHRILLEAKVGGPVLRPFGRLFLHAGEDLLPPWAQDLMGLRRQVAARRPLVRPGIIALAPAFRWALRNGAAARARLRSAAPVHS